MKLHFCIAMALVAGSQSATATDYLYNATTASNYALKYYNTAYGTSTGQNPFPNYSGTGGNCTNFASQVFLAGISGATTPATVYAKRLNYAVDSTLNKNPKWFFKKDGAPGASTRGNAWIGATARVGRISVASYAAWKYENGA
jgi:hypothetical protein